MPSIIGEKIKARSTSSRSLPVSGHIRSGTQALIRASENAKGAQENYRRAAAGTISFKDAEKLILDANPGMKKAFTPRNTRHFNVYAHETEGGQVSVDNIMDRHGEVLGDDPEVRLYRIPVVFPPTPAGVEGFFKSEYSMAVGQIKYRSEYGDDGMRRCVYLKPVDPNEQASRKKHLRREPTIRKDCDPASCTEFGAGACKFRGRIHFYIPNVVGSGTFVFETGSANACEDIFMRLEELENSVGGMLPNFDPQGNPVFFLTKERKNVVFFENGVEKKTLQWVPVLQTSLIKSNILLIEEKKRLQLAAPAPTPSVASVPSSWVGASYGQNLPTTQAASSPQGSGNFDAHTDVDGVITSRHAEEPSQHDEPEVESGGTEVSKLTPLTSVTPTAPLQVAEVNTPEDALTSLLDLSDDHDLPIAEYGEAKFGENWDAGEAVMLLHKDMVDMLQALGNTDAVRVFLPLLTLLHKNGIPVKELAFPYFKAFFGEFKKKQVPEAMRHVEELLKSGAIVAKAHMNAKLKKAA